MTDNELLLAISNIMDKKIEPLQGEIGEMKGEIVEMKGDIAKMKGDIVEMKGEIVEMKGDIAKMKGEIVEMKGDITKLQGNYRKISLQLENNVIPHLNELSSCYTSTFQRYSSQLGKMDAYSQDMILLKEVVMEHSEKLKQLS